MELNELKIGMLLGACYRRYDHARNMRVEFVAADWGIARTDDGKPVMLEADQSFELYKEPEEN
jgi:hypothetical protein